MIRNAIYFFAVVLLTANTTLSEESDQGDLSDLETYVWLEREGISDPEVPNSRVHKLLSEGLKHEDEEIVLCSISTIVLYSGQVREVVVNGGTPRIDRKLGEIPGLYDMFVEMWEKGWEESKGVVPELQHPKDAIDRMMNKSGCLITDADNVWTTLAGPLAYLFPGDDKVYDIIWKQLPQHGEGSLLLGLYVGQFNNPKDEEYRIDFLTNTETELYWSKLAARSLGEFRSERGLDTLVQVLQNDNMKYGLPEFVIVEAIMKYEADATPYLDLMRETLENSLSIGSVERDLRTTLTERLVHFEEKYAEEAENPSR